MRLKSIYVRRTPGIEDGFRVDEVGPALNLVTGPNGIGKTSLCNAVRALLWPGQDPSISVEAAWEDAQGDLSADLERGKTTWRRDGEPVQVELPQPHLADCFTVRIDQLLPRTAEDAELAARIAKEMAGGYDLAALGQLFEPAPARARNPGLQEARRKVQECENAQDQLRIRESRLPQLREARDAAQAASQEIPLLKAAEKLARERQRLDGLAARKAAFPAGMERLAAGDGERLEHLRESLLGVLKRKDDALAQQAAAADEIRRYALPNDEPVSDELLAEWDARAEVLAGAEHALADARRELAGAEAGRASAAQAMAPGVAVPQGLAFSPGDVEAAEAHLREAEKLRAERSAIEWERAWLQVEGECPEPARVVDGIRALAAWLAAATTQPPGWTLARRLTIALFAMLALAGGVGAVRLHPALWLVAAMGLAGAALSWLLLRPASAGVGRRQELEGEFRKLGLPAPASWEAAAVEQRLQALATECGPAGMAQVKRAALPGLEARGRRLEQEERSAEQARARFRQDTGFDLDGLGLDRLLLVRHLVKFYDEDAACRQAEAEVDRRRAAVGAETEALNAFLKAFGIEIGDSIGARQALAGLRERSIRLAGAVAAYREASRSIGDADAGIGDCKRRIRAFLDERGLADEPAFDERMARWQEWTALCGEEREAQLLVQQVLKELADRPDLHEMSLEAARETLDAAEARAAGLGSHQDAIAAIEAEVTLRKLQNDLSAARAGLEQQVAEIADRRDQSLLAQAGRFLLQEVDRDQALHQPAILTRASDLLHQFTRGAYRLRLRRGEGGTSPTYQALEVDTNRGKPIADLSAGTRVQALLAARLAFAEHAEGPVRLPIFLDEALKHSDPERYQAIGECLRQLVAEGRQVLYLTNDPVDEGRLRRAFGEGAPAITSVDLAAARARGRWWAVSAEPLPDLPRLPDPAGKSAAEYRECLPVPPLNPYAPLESLHLFYLLPDDLQLLHRLLQFGIATMGRWRDLRQTGRAQLGLEPGDAEALDAWASVAEAFWEAWHIGRGLPLTRQALLDGGVSGTFIAPVWELAQECGGDARTLMERLRAKDVARFRAEACSRLDDHLREQGHLCPDDPLDEEGICVRVFNGADIGPLAPETVRIRVHELCAEASRFMPLG